ncbi:HNH endonuclease signature motif containing protein [Microbacterium sp. Se5.02b]|uniref:HNH endonuclease signature motif containing protein n=1 Tax=Microbacterium sp. Se5.02b TaxID=2864103 RepID=UPI001C6908D5|nr:HNH endonuclease signature motif containing protein [Microbacterium sp. Se5.02b]QYM63308.1 HNH endonuclease [Microbacterium sp. Se5.02b]
MTALLDATDAQLAMLADLVASLEAAEATLSSMHAARDGMLAMAGRLAVDIARAAAHPDHGDMAIRTVAAEIGAAQHVSDRTIERRMAEASWLVERFPTVWQAQGEGRITAAHARVIVEAGAHLDDDTDRAAYAAEVVELAVHESPNRLRRMARRIAERFQERSITERHRDARELRRVWVKDLDDGMAELGARGPAVLLHGMFDRLSQMAHAVQEESTRASRDAATDGVSGTDDGGPVDGRTVDQLRADLLVDLALTGAPAGHETTESLLGEIRARVEVTVPVLTLMDDDTSASGSSAAGSSAAGSSASTPPAELDGTVPIDALTARTLAGSAVGWDRVLTHPISGALLAVDRYRPSEQLRRHLRARDQRCRFPGCGIAARKCDLDHNHAASTGGATSDTNLSAFCRRHHMLKHHSPWHVDQRPGGVLEWTGPTGRTYIDRPPPQNTVTFTAAPASVEPALTPF